MTVDCKTILQAALIAAAVMAGIAALTQATHVYRKTTMAEAPRTKDILVLSEREALSLIAYYPQETTAKEAADSMRMIALHTLRSQKYLENDALINHKGKFQIAVMLNGEWILQPEEYPTLKAARTAEGTYSCTTSIRPVAEQATDAYAGAREDLLVWKRRAQRAEDTARAIAAVTTEWLQPCDPLASTLKAEATLIKIIERLDESEIDFKIPAPQALRAVDEVQEDASSEPDDFSPST